MSLLRLGLPAIATNVLKLAFKAGGEQNTPLTW